MEKRIRLATLLLTSAAIADAANPLIPPGDLSLRHDIQLLADRGIVSGPVTSWPLAWGPILADLDRLDADALTSAAVSMAIARIRQRAAWETRTGSPQYRARIAASENPQRLRSFADTPRESGEIGGGVSWIGERFSIEINGQAVTSPDDGEEFRADGSLIGVAIGNYSVAAGTMQRWWGPGWDGSLILSGNARPIPALTVDRNFTDPFESPWLRWLGPWDVSVLFGQMESARAVPDARFFGLRFTFRPLESLEIGLSRTAQWCGEDRPCDLDTFGNLLIGRDNRGGSGIDASNEPGNQLAGVDARWAVSLLDRPLAVYGQFIGEDEAGGFPSRYLAQAGLETRGLFRGRWSYQAFAEVAGTSCDVVKEDIFNCAYNHGTYQTGYRYRGRSIGHPADGDALLVSAGLTMTDAGGNSWHAIARGGELNRGGPQDPRHSLTPIPEDVLEIRLQHRRFFRYGQLEVGVGFEQRDSTDPAGSDDLWSGFVQWRSSY